MLFSRENQAYPQACRHLKAISSAIEQLQRKITQPLRNERRRSAAPQEISHGPRHRRLGWDLYLGGNRVALLGGSHAFTSPAKSDWSSWRTGRIASEGPPWGAVGRCFGHNRGLFEHGRGARADTDHPPFLYRRRHRRGGKSRRP